MQTQQNPLEGHQPTEAQQRIIAEYTAKADAIIAAYEVGAKENPSQGKWIVRRNDDCPGEFKGAFIYAGSCKIADVSARTVLSQAECEANAHMMAASKNMYLLLKDLGKAIEKGDSLAIADIWAFQGRRVLAKAEGKANA